MKKTVALILCFLLSLSLCPISFAEEEVLRVYNWQDYIDEGKDEDGAKISDSVIELWEKDYFERTGKKVRVQYDTFETNETMLNTLRTGKTSYDLVCPSDYIIQKMLIATKTGTEESISIEKYDISKMENYNKYVSPYISDLFEKNGWTDYAICYMWGTVGFLYNPEEVKREDVSTWDFFWNTAYKNRMTCKDVSRDAYVVGSLYVNREELRSARKKYENGKISAEEYTAIVNGVANNVEDSNIEKVGAQLSVMKENIYGFEVDSGKTDIVTGKIDANLAWSGDAVYSMDLAEEEDDKKLAFAVPDEGSTIYFDGWVMPKGANTHLAQDFVDFLCRPDIAALNMNYIGYTSAIAGDELYDLVCENYGDEEGEYEHDLSYFFKGTLSPDRYTEDGRVIVRTSEIGRQLTTQYPSFEETVRCGVMEDFGEQNQKVLEMWSQVKSNNISAFSYVMMAVLFILAVLMLVSTIKRKMKKRRMRR